MDHAAAEGIDALEGQHHVQLDLLTALRAAATTQERVEILNHLVDYTQVHFASEQLLMRLYAYPHFQEHVADHERAMERLAALRATLSGSDAEVLAEADGLATLVSRHIDDADQRFAEFLSGMRASATSGSGR